MRIFYAGTQQGYQKKTEDRIRQRDTRTINDVLLCQMRVLYLDDPAITASALGPRFGCTASVAQKYLDVLDSEPFPYA